MGNYREKDQLSNISYSSKCEHSILAHVCHLLIWFVDLHMLSDFLIRFSVMSICILLLSEIQEFHKYLSSCGSKNSWNLSQKKNPDIFKSHFELMCVQHSKLPTWKFTPITKCSLIFLVVDWNAHTKEGGVPNTQTHGVHTIIHQNLRISMHW